MLSNVLVLNIVIVCQILTPTSPYKHFSNYLAVVTFPSELMSYGLNEELLLEVFAQVQNEEPIIWHIRGIPDNGFYQDVHQYLKRSPYTRDNSKVSIGKFYNSIDKNLQDCSFTPFNAYRFIDKLVTSSHPRDAIVRYSRQVDTEPARDTCQLQTQLMEYTNVIDNLSAELLQMKTELDCSQDAFMDATKKLKAVTTQLKKSQSQLSSVNQLCESTLADFNLLEENFDSIEEQNYDLSKALVHVEKELLAITNGTTIIINEEGSFYFVTKHGQKQYLPAVRKLYYSLLADQVPAGKIESVIKRVLKSFLPNLDVDCLQLPKERCAGYMRGDELATVSLAHKASVISDKASKGMLHINTDGTTLQQKKLGGIAIENMVISVNEQPSGSADSIIGDVSNQLERLRTMANALGLPHSDTINWTLVSCSTSDSASTQKRFNKLMIKKSLEMIVPLMDLI